MARAVVLLVILVVAILTVLALRPLFTLEPRVAEFLTTFLGRREDRLCASARRDSEPIQRLAGALPIRVGRATLQVELAQTPIKWAQGLSNRDTLDADAGMLFVFPTLETQTFWMKDTRIPLDLVWIRGGRVVEVTANVQPEPGVPDDALRRYTSPGPVHCVLETNAGWAATHGARTGDRLRALRAP